MSRRDDDVDEFSNPSNPKILKYDDVETAAKTIRPLVLQTPCLAAHTQRDFGIYIHYKLECLQNSGCFKERGALYVLQKLAPDKKKAGVIIGATGNEALGLCCHTKKMNIPTTVVTPVSMPISKIEKIQSLGGKVVLHGTTFTAAMKYARSLAREKGMCYINVRDHLDALAGVGTMALELLEQAPFADAILVPIGTGGLAAAVATVIKAKNPDCLVYGVEPENLGLLTRSLETGEPVHDPRDITPSLAGNALCVNHIGINAFATVRPLLDKVLLVKEDWIARAMLHLAEREKFIVEGIAACSLAAILGGLVPELKQKNVVCILSGGNVDNLILNRSLQRGLAAEGRLVRFKVGIYHRPGAKADLTKLVSSGGYNIFTHFIDNFWTETDTCRAEMTIVAETKNVQHGMELKRLVEKSYPNSTTFDNPPFNDKRTCPCYVKKNK